LSKKKNIFIVRILNIVKHIRLPGNESSAQCVVEKILVCLPKIIE